MQSPSVQKLIFLPNPNNPTGTANSTKEIKAFVQALGQIIFCLDEAYAEYLDEPLTFDLSSRKEEKSWDCVPSPRFTA